MEIDLSQIYVSKIYVGKKKQRIAAFCIDTGAPTSVIGLKQLRYLSSKFGKQILSLTKSKKKFRFADSTFESLGQVQLPMQTPQQIQPIQVIMDVVSANVPALLRLYTLDWESLIVDNVANKLTKRVHVSDAKFFDIWSVPIMRHESHLFVAMETVESFYFTRTQLYKLHRQFAHPSTEKLYNLLKRARPDETSSETLKTLQDLSKRCDPCQRIQDAPNRFRVSFGAEGVKFNERLLIDVMYIDGKPVLHIVDEGTRFSAAKFLPDVSTKTIWKTLLQSWACTYTGLPRKILVDQGSSFGKFFVHIAALGNVDVQHTGIESHNSLGLGERYHAPLRNTFRKLKLSFPKEENDLPLSFATKALNDTLGPEGLVPSALVFGEYPSPYTISENVSERIDLASRAQVADQARREMEKQMAETRIRRALKHKVPTASDKHFQVGDNVLIWREKQVENRIGEWIGPFIVKGIDRERKLVFVQDSEIGQARPFNLVQVKKYITSEEISHSFFSELHKCFNEFKSHPEPDSLFPSEVISPKDPRATSPKMNQAKSKEVHSLQKRDAFRIVPLATLPPDANILPGRFVLSIKEDENGKQNYKARYVIGGHKDKLKKLMVHSSQTLQPSLIRLILAIAALNDYEVWTSDIRQAYIQSTEQLQRNVYIKNPPPEFKLSQSDCLQLLKPLYGLSESGDLWFNSLDKHHREDLLMKSLKHDPSFYYDKEKNKLLGMSGTYVDDIIRGGTKRFKEKCKLTSKKFEMAKSKDLPALFTGFQINKTPNGFSIDQEKYAASIEHVPKNSDYSIFSSTRMKLYWLSHTRADCLYEVSQLAQVTPDIFEAERPSIIKTCNRIIKHVKTVHLCLNYPKLDKESLKVVGFSDASFSLNKDLTSHLGYIILITDKTNKFLPLLFRSYKARRITRSVMAAESIAFSDLFDAAFTLREDISALLSKRIPLHLYTDSKSLFDVISKGTRTAEERLMLDLHAARNGFKTHEINNIGFVRSNNILADAFTKRMKQGLLTKVLSSSELDIDVEQWIIRN